MDKKEIITRFAEIQNISQEEAVALIDGDSEEAILENIKNFTRQKIQDSLPPLNRKQRRQLQKKAGKKGRDTAQTVTSTAEKLTYINLIQKLRALNEKKENENERLS